MRRALTGSPRGIALLAAAATLSGCGGHSSRAPSPDDAITHFDASPDRLVASFRALDDAALTHAAQTRQAAISRLREEDPGVHYAALYALALTVAPGEATRRLESGLSSSNISERLVAARSLLAHGDKRAIPVLIEALRENFVPAFGNPPEAAWQVARFDLLQYVPVNLGLVGRHLDAAAAKAAARRWRAWWATNGDSLRWDSSARVYRVR
jgi:HEAT repeat protein